MSYVTYTYIGVEETLFTLFDIKTNEDNALAYYPSPYMASADNDNVKVCYRLYFICCMLYVVCYIAYQTHIHTYSYTHTHTHTQTKTYKQTNKTKHTHR
jgi:hypothetical protein